MESLKNRCVLITGASSGIGAACARAFAGLGCRLLLSARRKERVQALADDLHARFGADTHTAGLDVRDRTAVERYVTSLPASWASVDILINNAGLSRGLDKLHEGSTDDWDEMLDTNVKGLLYVTRAVLPGMVARGRGHVINIGSIAGHQVYPNGNVYCASKHAVRALNTGLRMDLLGTGVRVSSIDPGLVETEFSVVRFHGDTERAAKVYQNTRPLDPGDVADAAVYCATRPPHVDVAEIVVMPTDQASVSHVHRTA